MCFLFVNECKLFVLKIIAEMYFFFLCGWFPLASEMPTEAELEAKSESESQESYDLVEIKTT